ncbi:MAG: alpha/beta hydrolase [Pseudomonadota bacterium]
MLDFSKPRMTPVGGVDLAVYETGPADGPTVLCVHGWPELAYSWKRLMTDLAAAGYRAVAFDLPGYGRSGAPAAVEAWSSDAIADLIAGLIDELGLGKPVLCGHDWGGAVVWRAGQRHAEKLAGIIAVCTAHHARPPADPIAIWRKRIGEDHYILRFQEEGPPEARLERDMEHTLRFIFQKPAKAETIAKRGGDLLRVLDHMEASGPVPDGRIVMGPEDLAVYVEAFSRNGMGKALNLYRNITRNWEDQAAYSDVIDLPALMISADRDVMLPPSAADGLERLVPRVEKHVLEGVGHWVQYEAPDDLSRLSLDWLRRTFPAH